MPRVLQTIFVVLSITLIVAINLLGMLFFVDESRIVPAFSLTNSLIIAAISILVIFFVFYISRHMSMFAHHKTKIKNLALYSSVLVACIACIASIVILNGRVEYLFDSKTIIDIVSIYDCCNYIETFPYQIPFIVILKILNLLFGDGMIVAYWAINLAAVLGIIVAIHKISELLFSRTSITVAATALSALFIPYLYYIPHLYGDLAGVSLSLAGTFFALSYIKNESFWSILTAVIMFVLAMIFKGNIIIILYVILAILLFFAYSRRNVWFAVCGFAILLVPSLIQTSIINIYTDRYNIDTSRSWPKIVYVAVGLKYNDRESPEINSQDITPGSWAPGITSGYIMKGLSSTTPEKYNSYLVNIILMELEVFIHNPLYAFNFFAQKTVATWNNASFEGPDRLGYAVDSVGLYDNSSATGKVTRWLAKAHQTIVYVLVLIGLLSFRKSRKSSLLVATILLLFIAGFVFSMLWEVMSRSVLYYYFILFPIAGYGCVIMYDLSVSRQRKFYNTTQEALAE